MNIEFLDTKPKPVKRWKQLADQRIKTFQVQYVHKGKTWLQDINVIPGQDFYDDPITYAFCWLCLRIGKVSEVQILKEY